jgi:hypothetical protein
MNGAMHVRRNYANHRMYNNTQHGTLIVTVLNLKKSGKFISGKSSQTRKQEHYHATSRIYLTTFHAQLHRCRWGSSEHVC